VKEVLHQNLLFLHARAISSDLFDCKARLNYEYKSRYRITMCHFIGATEQQRHMHAKFHTFSMCHGAKYQLTGKQWRKESVVGVLKALVWHGARCKGPWLGARGRGVRDPVWQ
jgi:hypothetical protein